VSQDLGCLPTFDSAIQASWNRNFTFVLKGLKRPSGSKIFTATSRKLHLVSCFVAMLRFFMLRRSESFFLSQITPSTLTEVSTFLLLLGSIARCQAHCLQICGVSLSLLWRTQEVPPLFFGPLPNFSTLLAHRPCRVGLLQWHLRVSRSVQTDQHASIPHQSPEMGLKWPQKWQMSFKRFKVSGTGCSFSRNILSSLFLAQVWFGGTSCWCPEWKQLGSGKT